MSQPDTMPADSGGINHTSTQSASHASRTQHAEEQDSAWTVVDVAEPEDSTDDDDRSLVNISRVSSPLLVQFSGLDLEDCPEVRIPWPSNLPWFQFQDRFFNNSAARAMFATQIKVNPSTRNYPETAETGLTVLSQEQSLTTQAGFTHAVSKVNNLMPEQFDGENASRVKGLTGADPLEAKIQEFQLFAYQLSNNLIEDDDEDDTYLEEAGNNTKIIEIFRGIGLPHSVWKDLIIKSLEQPTGRAFAEALFSAAVNAHALDICEVLLEAGVDPDKVVLIWVAGRLGRPVQLGMDCRVRSVDLLRLLVRFGAGLELVTEDEPDTALLMAAKECGLEAVRVLVKAGANIEEKRWESHHLTATTVLTSAVDADWRKNHFRDDAEKDDMARSGNELAGLQTLKYLLTLYDREKHHEIIQSGLLRAAEGARYDMIMDLVHAGADVNEASPSGYTPLIAATMKSYKGSSARTIKMLLDIGADIHKAFGCESICAIHIAAAKGDEKVIQVLIDRGADVNAATSCHTTGGYSLLGSHFERDDLAPETLRELEACRRPLQFALFKSKEKEPSYSIKSGRVALALIRAGATLSSGDLARAARFHDADLLREVLSLGAEVNEVDGTGRSALQTCLKFGNLGLVKFLLDSGAMVRNGDLFSAIKAGNRSTVQMLLDHGAAIDELHQECSVLEAAALSKNWGLMAWLMWAHNIPYDEGALCAAVCSGLGSSKENEKYLRFLLWKRAKERTGGILEATALGYAAFHKEWWVVWYLLHLNIKGPCIFPVEDDDAYQRMSRPSAVGWSYQYKKRFWVDPAMTHCSVLVPAIFSHEWRIVFRLLRAGHKPDKLSLLVAINYQCSAVIGSIIRCMNKLKLDIHQPALSNLETPLQAAVRHRRVDVVRRLLSLGADVNAPAPEWLSVQIDWDDPLLPRTALQAAVENGHMEMIDLLLDAGADVNNLPGSNSGATALQIAAAKGHIGIARRLLDLGADVNIEGAILNGRSALEAAAEGGRLDMMQFLLEEGAVVDYPDIRMWQYDMAVDWAEQKGYGAIVEVLKTWRRENVTDWEDEESELGEPWSSDETNDSYEDDQEGDNGDDLEED